MNKKLLGIFMFAVGAATGSAVTWKILKDRYEQLVQEDAASLREEYANLMQEMKDKLKETATIEEEVNQDDIPDEYYLDDDERDLTEQEKDQIEYYKITSRYRGSDEYDEKGGKQDLDESDVQTINGPYVISPEEFSSSPPGYDAQPLDYFADGILADNWGVKVNIEDTIGEDNLDCFGEYADDVLYVRNERLEIDYEVTKDPRTYEDVVLTNPNPYYGKYEN